MEKKISKFVTDLDKNAKDFIQKSIDTVTQMADQNEDGKLDLDDVSIAVDSAMDTMKKSAHTLKATAKEKAKLLELKNLQPIFKKDINNSEFSMSKFIRITDRDKKYVDSEVCKGSIGFISRPKGIRMVNIFRDSVSEFALSFYQNGEEEFYYVDPCDKTRYIALEEYFNYLRIVRINELQKIAQDLGAKHFRITYKEEKSSFSGKNKKINAQGLTSSDIKLNTEDKKYSSVEVAAEMKFPGHEPVNPSLKYWESDPNIKTLISMRMNEDTPLIHQKLMIKLSHSSGLKESDAIKIDAILKGMKCNGNATFVSEVQNEARRYLEYEVNF